MSENQNNRTSVGQILAEMNKLAPPELAAEWDTAIGLEIGHPDAPVSGVLITLDVTKEAIAAAKNNGSELIIAHHPLLFSPLPTIRQDVPEQQLAVEMIEAGMHLIAAHTNLDAAEGGVADQLADRLNIGKQNRQAVGMYGRYGDMTRIMMLSELIDFVRRTLNSPGCRVNTDQDRPVSRLAVFPGSFSEEELPTLMAVGADCLVCGEIKHHVSLMLAARGIAAIDAGHDVTERVVLRPLADRLALRLPEITFAVYEGLDYNGVAFRANQTTAGAGRKAAHEESPGSIG